MDREQDLVPVKYFHVIFTLPSEVNQLAKAYPGPLYNVLFKAAWYTIKTLSADPKWIGGEGGMIAASHPLAVRSLGCPLDIHTCGIAHSYTWAPLEMSISNGVGSELITTSTLTLFNTQWSLGSCQETLDIP